MAQINSGPIQGTRRNAGDESWPISWGPIETRTIETKAGHVGQVVVNGEILWESNAFEERDAAVKDANSLVVDKIKGLFL